MKFFVVFAIFAILIYDSATAIDPANKPLLTTERTPISELLVSFLSKGDDFKGEFQESEDSKVESIGTFAVNADDDLLSAGVLGIPSCKLGNKVGVPNCIAKCISRGRIAGYCFNSKCICIG